MRPYDLDPKLLPTLHLHVGGRWCVDFCEHKVVRRIQRKRTRGSRMPDSATYVGRPSRWGNPFAARIPHGEVLQDRATRAVLVEQFALWLIEGMRAESVVARLPLYDPRGKVWIATTPLTNRPTREVVRTELAGRDLACWCPLDQPCHADVLLEVANR